MFLYKQEMYAWLIVFIQNVGQKQNSFRKKGTMHRGRDCMLVGFITTYAISTYHH